MKSGFYTVWNGRNPGVYPTWAETAEQVNGFPGARFKKFNSQAAAADALERPWQDFIDHSGGRNGKPSEQSLHAQAAVLDPSVLEAEIIDDGEAPF
jgi:viroplasmin and RNaseH domain-containing protein